MKSPKERKPLFDRLKAGMEEAIRHSRGEVALKTTVVEQPDPPPEIQPDELAKLRTDNAMSQEVFARVLNVPTRSIRSWEDGTRRPSQAALRLIQVFRQNTAGVLEVVGMTAAPSPREERHTQPARSRKRTPPGMRT
jgi:putative transcriptional regulator